MPERGGAECHCSVSNAGGEGSLPARVRKRSRQHLRPVTRREPTLGSRVLVTACERTQPERLELLGLSRVSAGAYLAPWQSPDEKETCGRAAAFFTTQTMRPSSRQTSSADVINVRSFCPIRIYFRHSMFSRMFMLQRLPVYELTSKHNKAKQQQKEQLLSPERLQFPPPPAEGAPRCSMCRMEVLSTSGHY